jgi:hypothetical protein
MKRLFKFLVVLGIFFGALSVLANHGLGKDTPRMQVNGCCAAISDDGK